MIFALTVILTDSFQGSKECASWEKTQDTSDEDCMKWASSFMAMMILLLSPYFFICLVR